MRCPNCGYENHSEGQNTPISMWGYFGYELLFSIPVIGLICIIVFACGVGGNINVRNFARSYFCFMIIILLLISALVISSGALYAILDALRYNLF